MAARAHWRRGNSLLLDCSSSGQDIVGFPRPLVLFELRDGFFWICCMLIEFPARGAGLKWGDT